MSTTSIGFVKAICWLCKCCALNCLNINVSKGHTMKITRNIIHIYICLHTFCIPISPLDAFISRDIALKLTNFIKIFKSGYLGFHIKKKFFFEKF